MSEASKAAALAYAATVHHGSRDAESTIATAEAFHDFISGADKAAAPAPPAKAPAPPAKAPAPPAKAPPKKAPPAEEPEADADEDGVTKEQVGEAIEALLNADMRPQVMKLFAKFKAKSLSGVKPEDYAAFKTAAEDLLLNS